ncbi:MAG: CocE/NonD family hydrolase, partial [Haliea sp.]|uniref:CocE/NonD family hydrolase n=1 Tax=Haliea sp. TaxID=1932666 RepID=UPI0032EDC9D7
MRNHSAAQALSGVALVAVAGWLAFDAVSTGGPTRYLQAAFPLAAALALLGRRSGLLSTLLVWMIAVMAALVRAGSIALSAVEVMTVVLTAGAMLLAAVAFAAARRKSWLLAVPVALAVIVVATLSFGSIRNTLTPIDNLSVYVEMDDGTRLAVDYRLPRGFDGDPRPGIITFTRYHRASRLRFPFNLLFSTESGNTQRLLDAGYAVVVVDVRGAGASFGTRPKEFSEREIQDYPLIVDWVVSQSWSNGVVGAEGVSYGGTAAELLMLQDHPAVKAIAAQYSLFDAYDDAAFPGGLENVHITTAWGQMLRDLDRNEPPPGVGWLGRLAWGGVRPVDGPEGSRLLEAAIAQHRLNYDFSDGLEVVEFRDDRLAGRTIFDGSPAAYLPALRQNRTPLLLVSGWLDGAYQASAFKKLANSDNPDLDLVIGPWDHGPATTIDPCKYRPNARRGNRSSFTLPFFDYYLRGLANGYEQQPRIRYYMLCGGQWHASQSWPPSTAEYRLYLEDGMLGESVPLVADIREHAVNPGETSGPASRWASLVRVPGTGLPTGYDDREDRSERLANFTSLPLLQALEIAGHPRLQIQLESSEPDGALIIYLEDVAPDGSVRYVTEGSLRLGNRRVDSPPHYKDYSPVRSHLRRDFEPMPLGQAVPIEVGLLPVAYRFAAGHRIRLSIAGADADNFGEVAQKPPIYRVHWGPQKHTSFVLPMEASKPLVWHRPHQEYP